jgi:putative transposase
LSRTKEEYKAMIPLECVEDYLVDPQSGLKAIITWFLNLVMQLEAEQQAGADRYKRSANRKAHRNGMVKRTLKSRVGELTLDKPQFREFPFRTGVFDRYSRTEKALLNVIVESYLQGVSTRKIKEIISHLGVDQISAMTVSRIAQELDEQVEQFLKRPLDREFPYIFVDASYFKVRDCGRYINKALLIVVGVRDDGFREILGAKITDCEDELFWAGFFDELISRGLNGVRLVISDGHKGIQNAVQKSFIGASWQMCQVHFVRAVLKNILKKERREYAEKLREALLDKSKMKMLIKELEAKGYLKSINTIDRFQSDIRNFESFPKAHQKRIRTTNGVERINKELKRRTRVAGAFPNEKSLLRLAGSILMDINEEWVTGTRYLSMEEE